MIKPTATVGAGSKIQTRTNAVNGRPINWAVSPIAAAFGNVTTRLKSAKVNDRPKPNITKRSTQGITLELMNALCSTRKSIVFFSLISEKEV